MSLFILIGLPIVAIVAYIRSKINILKYDKDLLALIFSLRLFDEKSAEILTPDFSPVNMLTESDLTDLSVCRTNYNKQE